MVERAMRTRRGVLVAAIGLSPAIPSLAQSYPQKPVRLVVGNAAGGSDDLLLR